MISSKYLIIKELGEIKKRKINSVHLGKDITSGDFVVIKTLNKKNNSNYLNYLKSESRFNFSKKGLPNVIDVFESDSEFSLILQYKEGETLDEFWKKVKKKNRESTLIELLKKLQPIFECLKNQGIVHCDLKHSNIIINHKNGDLECHLIDFGLAIDSENDLFYSKIFSLSNGSPEQILNERQILNHTSDLYSLGIIIYKLLSDTSPFYNANPSISTNLQVNQLLPNNRKINKKWFEVIKKMTHKHQFKKPPHFYSSTEKKVFLTNAQKMRYFDLKHVIVDLEINKCQKIKWKNYLIKIFSKTKAYTKQ